MSLATSGLSGCQRDRVGERDRCRGIRRGPLQPGVARSAPSRPWRWFLRFGGRRGRLSGGRWSGGREAAVGILAGSVATASPSMARGVDRRFAVAAGAAAGRASSGARAPRAIDLSMCCSSASAFIGPVLARARGHPCPVKPTPRRHPHRRSDTPLLPKSSAKQRERTNLHQKDVPPHR